MKAAQLSSLLLARKGEAVPATPNARADQVIARLQGLAGEAKEGASQAPSLPSGEVRQPPPHSEVARSSDAPGPSERTGPSKPLSITAVQSEEPKARPQSQEEARIEVHFEKVAGKSEEKLAERPARAALSPTVQRPSEPKPKTAGSQARNGSTGQSSANPAQDIARLSLRLDRERHRKLRILAAQRGQSLQQVLIEALDGQFQEAAQQEDGGFCACLGQRVGPDHACGSLRHPDKGCDIS